MDFKTEPTYFTSSFTRPGFYTHNECEPNVIRYFDKSHSDNECCDAIANRNVCDYDSNETKEDASIHLKVVKTKMDLPIENYAENALCPVDVFPLKYEDYNTEEHFYSGAGQINQEYDSMASKRVKYEVEFCSVNNMRPIKHEAFETDDNFHAEYGDMDENLIHIQKRIQFPSVRYTPNDITPLYVSFEPNDSSKFPMQKENIERDPQTVQLKIARIRLDRVRFFDKNFVCNGCYSVFRTPVVLKTHRKRCAHLHTSSDNTFHNPSSAAKKRFECNACAYRSDSSDMFKIHEMKHNGEKPFMCEVCLHKFSQCAHLKRHKMIHSGEKPYKCTTCPYKCTSSGDLRKHEMIHTGEKPHKCNVCSYQCNQYSQLKSHKMIHTGEKPYKCDVCTYKCTSSGDLKKHKFIHTGEKPHKCDLCSYQCNRSNQLKIHKITHSGEKRHTCADCPYKSSTHFLLKRHIKLVHNDKYTD